MAGTDERIRAMILDAAAELLGAAHEPAGYNEYGGVVTPGYKVEASTRLDYVRIECKLPDSDLSDPSRMGSDEKYEARLAARDAYAATFQAAGWMVEKRLVLGNRPILFAAPPKSEGQR